MKLLYEYTDYREFLRDFQADAQARNPAFSIRAFLKKASISNPSYFGQVLKGDRNLTEKTLNAFLMAMRLPPQEDLYFRSLVHFCQSSSSEEKQLHYGRLRTLGEQAKVRIVGSENYAFYEHWYTPVIRELVCLHNFHEDWNALAKSLQPAISQSEAKQSVKLLLELGFIQESKNGSYVQADKLLYTGYEVHSLAVRQFHKQMIQLAAESLERYPTSQRSITGVTLSVSSQTYAQLEEEVRNFQERILKIAEQDQSAEKILQVHVGVFPVGLVPQKSVT